MILAFGEVTYGIKDHGAPDPDDEDTPCILRVFCTCGLLEFLREVLWVRGNFGRSRYHDRSVGSNVLP